MKVVLFFDIQSMIGTKNTLGGCWPSHLPVEVDRDNVYINTDDIEKKAYMFR